MTDTNTDSRLARVTTPYLNAYKCYFKNSDDRVAKGLKQITFEEYLWNMAEKEADYE